MLSKQPVILIVDDDKNNVLALEKVFQREGLDVLTSLNGEDALDLCRGGGRRRGPHRPDDAGHGRLGAPGRGEGHLSRLGGRPHDRVRYGRERGGRDEARRLRFRREAGEAPGHSSNREEGPREALTRPGEQDPQAPPHEVREARHSRKRRGLQTLHGDRGTGGPVHGDRPGHRRVGDRQGARCPRGSRQLCEGGRTLRGRELRGDPRDDNGGGAVRSRARGLHGRGAEAGRGGSSRRTEGPFF